MGDQFEVRVAWPADASQKLPPEPAFSRNNRLAAPGKVEIPGSAPVEFGGDPQGYNPEELLLLFVRKGTNLDEARALHEKAHASCFIANSVNFPVRNEPEVVER
jgi:organic hydroperoxide reductase OsmC/OhrA